MADKEKDIEKQISVRLPQTAALAGAQELIDAQLVNLPRGGFSLHIQFVERPTLRPTFEQNI